MRNDDKPATVMLALATVLFMVAAIRWPTLAGVYGVASAACAAGTVWYLARSER